MIIYLDGKSISNKADLMNFISLLFGFPDYFGKNWDALSDCLDDLKWQNRDIELVIKNSDDLLNEEKDAREIFFELINKSLVKLKLT